MRDIKLVLGFFAVTIFATAYPLLAYVMLMELMKVLPSILEELFAR